MDNILFKKEVPIINIFKKIGEGFLTFLYLIYGFILIVPAIIFILVKEAGEEKFLQEKRRKLLTKG